MNSFEERARNMEFQKLLVQGAVSGLFFAQTLSWQQLVDVLVVLILGTAKDDPEVALWRAVIVTILTSLAAWFIISVAQWCDRCGRGISGRLQAATESRT